MRRVSLLAPLFLLPAAFVWAQSTGTALPQGVRQVTSVEGITEYQLANGLKVLLFPDPTKETITVNITYLVGSRHENYGETGMAHLLEHLVFKGSPRHTNIPQELTAHGARPNGTTWYDRTNYFETFSATDENLRWALDLEADRMVNSFIAKKDLDSEMTVVRNEFEMGENSPGRVLNQRVLATAFQWHNYGKSTIGAKADLENVPIDRLQAFYHNYYQPDNAILTVAGKIDEPKVLVQINDMFGKIPRPARKLTPTYTLDPVQDGERTVTVRRVGDVQAIEVVYHTPDAAHPDQAALDVLTEVMRRAPSGRLYKALVESKKAAMVNGYNYQLREPGVIGFGAQVRRENSLDDAKATLLKTIGEVVTTPPTKEEVDRAKAEILKQIDLALNNSSAIGLELSEPASAGDWRLFFLIRDRIKTVTPEDVLRIAKTYLKEDNRTVGLFIPTEKPDRTDVPALTDISSALKEYKGGQAVARGEAFDPSIPNIEKRIIKGQLGNGMKLVFIPKKTRGETVSAMVTVHYGDAKSLAGRSTAAALTAPMLMRGTAKHSRQEIQDELNRLKARVFTMGMGSSATRVMVETTRPNLPEVMKLVAEVLREPVFPESEFDQLKRQNLASNEQARTEPQALAMSNMQQLVNPYAKDDPRYVRTPDEQIAALQAVTWGDVKKFYKDFYGASRSELVVVGDFDPEKIQVMSRELFGDWKSPQPFEKLKYPLAKITAVNKMIETPDKANAMFVAGLQLNAGDEHPDYPALVFGNYLLGGGFLNSRLASRIRQKEGLSYGVGSAISARPKDETGLFMAYAICAPQNILKVEAAFKDEIAKVLKEGFTADEVAEAKKGWLQAQRVSRSQDPELAGLLTNNAFEDRSLEFQAGVERKVEALTPDQIVAAMRRHLNPDQISFFKAGDFKKAGVAQ